MSTEFTGESSATHLRTVKNIWSVLSGIQQPEKCHEIYQTDPQTQFDKFTTSADLAPVNLQTLFFPERIDHLTANTELEKQNLKQVYKTYASFLFFGFWGYQTTMSYLSSLKGEIVVCNLCLLHLETRFQRRRVLFQHRGGKVVR
jgi:hypothetical protein